MTTSTVVIKDRPTGERGRIARREYLQKENASHRAVRRWFGRDEDPAAVERVAAIFELPAWAHGSIGLIDALFLYDMVACTRPQRVIEIGVASGVSSAVLLHALADAGIPIRSDAGPALTGFDLHPWCYFDRSRRVGSAAAQMAPVLAEGFELHTGATAHDAGIMLAPDSIDMAFIDGDHRHPAPTVDLLALLGVLRPGGWVLLHDIDLPAAAARYEQMHGVTVPWHHAGAQYLYDCWPFDKLRGRGPAFNIGALRLPQHQSITLADLGPILSHPLEMEPGERDRCILGIST